MLDDLKSSVTDDEDSRRTPLGIRSAIPINILKTAVIHSSNSLGNMLLLNGAT